MSAPVSEGDVVLDKYRVERVLGQGGMGVVVAATHVELQQRVALKFLLPSALLHPDLVERFAREARAAAKIQSRHVVRVIDTGRMPNGAPFMVMEYLEGRDLAEALDKDGSLAIKVAVDHVLQACEAIGEAHSAGVVHRDLKPSNLFLAKQRDRRSIVKVLDFGISKVEDPMSAPITQTATMVGSPHYMSPEQLTSSKDVDPRTDIWSLGVILYELLAGVRPFRGDTMPEIVARILQNEPEPLGTVREDVPAELEAVVARCLTSFARERYASVAELAAALQPFASDAAVAAASVGRIARVLGANSLPPSAEPAVPVSVRIELPPKTPASDASTRREGVTAATLAQADTAHAMPAVVSPPSTPVLLEKRKVPSVAILGGLVAIAVIAWFGIHAFSAPPPAASTVTTSTASASSPLPTVTVSSEPSTSPSASASIAAAPSVSPSASIAPLPKTSPRPTASSKPAPTPVASTSSSAPKSPLKMGIK
jgi:serine/threonine protein kinase